MRKYLVNLGLWLVNTFGTEQGITYTVKPGRLSRKLLDLQKHSKLKAKAIEAWHTNNKLFSIDESNPTMLKEIK